MSPVIHRRFRTGLPVVLASTSLLAAGCVLGPSDPEDTPVNGVRAEGSTFVVKVPRCSTDKLRRVEVTDFDDTSDNPRLLWWASDPTTPSAREGIARLWTGEGFAHHAPKPAESAVPRNVEVDYIFSTGDGYGDVFSPRKVSKAKLKTGQFWTSNGPMTAEEIDAQLACTSDSAEPHQS